MSIGQIPVLISVYCTKAITQASLFRSQEEGFCLQRNVKSKNWIYHFRRVHNWSDL